MSYTIVLGNKNYSSWSMRPWLVLDHFALAYEEIVIPLDLPETRPSILKHSPAGKVPILIDGDVTVWDSMAIIEYLAEKHPEAGIWPADPAARARARSVAMEMHSGYPAVRYHLPMNLKAVKPFEPRGGADVERDVARFEAIVDDAIAASGGPFLFGAFSAADAMYAPMTARLSGYSWPMADATRRYVEAVQGEASYARWREAGIAEPWSHTHADAA